MTDIVEKLMNTSDTGADPEIIDAAIDEIKRLRAAIQQTLNENGHLADGENCTLIVLKRAIGMDDIQKYVVVKNMKYQGEVMCGSFDGTYYVLDDGDCYFPETLKKHYEVTFHDELPEM